MRKAIMKRSELITKKYRENPSDENLKAWKKQRNYCSNSYKSPPPPPIKEKARTIMIY